MGNAVLATPILSDAATITASDETTAGPVTNLQTMQPTDVWEAGGGAPYCEIDLGVVRTFNLIALLFTNATGADQWRIRTADTQGNLTAAPDQDSNYVTLTYVGSEGNIFLWIPAGWTNRWLRIDFITASNPLMSGRLYVSNGFQPQVLNYSYGAGDGYNDDSVIDRTDGGASIPNYGANRATFDFTMNLMNDAERHEIREINRLRGASRDVLLIRDPDESVYVQDVIYYGLLQALRSAIHTRWNRHQMNYQLTAL